MEKNLVKDRLAIMSLNEIFEALHSDERGLNQSEAEYRLKKYGPNTIKKHTSNALKILLRQLQGSLTYLLLAAGIMSYWIGNYSDGIIIVAILLINTLLSFFQEYRAEKTVEKLAQFITVPVRVTRDGQLILQDQSKIVPGDVVTIREGDVVPADVRLFETEALQINESQLTGESIAVTKRTSQNGAEETLAFAGSVVEKGVGKGVVYATGYQTEFGKIAKISSETKKKTQYEQSLLSFEAFLIKVVLLGLVLVFAFKLVLNGGFANGAELLLFIIASAVAMVPEALPVIATISLSRGALKLAHKHVVAKRLSSVEDLGNVTLLCTDKTGTITENKMVIKHLVSNDRDLFEKLAYASIVPLKRRKHRAENSYDDAFLNQAAPATIQAAKSLAIVKEIPFDPEERRRRVVLEDSKGNKRYLVVIGAPEILLKISHRGHKDRYLSHIEEEGRQGLHHLALSYKEIRNTDYKDDFDILKHERNLIFLGYVSLYDPLRHTAKNAIHHAEKLGVEVKVLTGDRKEVAEYIGKEIGLLLEHDKVYIGSELEKMTEKKFKEAVLKYHIFARVSPRQKYEIIKVLKQSHVVAYQGDGINDVPSLKLADVAIAVNTATDIAKESADIVILNESLEVIINGITYGRSIFVNINKYLEYTMINNFGNFMTLSVLYLISSASLPMLPIQILLTSLISDVPLVSVSADSVEDEEVVKPEKHNIKELIVMPLILGVPTALFELFYYLIIRNQPQAIIQTSLFLFFSATMLVFYAIRSKRHFWKSTMPPKKVNILFLFGFLFSIAIIYIPLFQRWFSFVPLSFTSVATILVLIAFYFLVIDIIKVWYYKKLTSK